MTDVGTGMDEATLKRATEPFFSTKGVGKGSGLGLSMVHGLAAQSNGAMCIKSRVGEGTTVELWLPAAEQADLGPAMVAPASAGAAPACRVLLVDDDALITASTAAILEESGPSSDRSVFGGKCSGGAAFWGTDRPRDHGPRNAKHDRNRACAANQAGLAELTYYSCVGVCGLAGRRRGMAAPACQAIPAE